MEKLILAGLIVLGLSGHTTALEVTGQARVIDGDTLNLEGISVRLHSLVGTSEGREFDQYRRLIAVCRSGVTELNHAMVIEGHAWAFVRFSEDYIAAEHEARSAKRGVFAANNQPPWDFRLSAWSAAQALSQRQDCPIKGNVNRSGERIYHMPWQPDYARIRMDQGEGKRWFCDENEAVAAGWRKAAR